MLDSLVPRPATFSVTQRKVTGCNTENGAGLGTRLNVFDYHITGGLTHCLQYGKSDLQLQE